MSEFIAAEPMSDNQALRLMLGGLVNIESTLSQQYDRIEGSDEITLASGEEETRIATSTAVKTVVTNISATDLALKVFEEGSLVGVIGKSESWVSPLNGAGEITISAVTGPVKAVITTYIKD